MSPDNNLLRQTTRRHFFSDAGLGIGSLGLASILSGKTLLGKEKAAPQRTHSLSPRATHFPAQAKRVIYLFMAGGPSQLELFDFKPKLQEMDGQVIPESYVKKQAIRVLEERCQVARNPAGLQAAWRIRAGDLRVTTKPGKYRRPDCHCPHGKDRGL